VRFSALRLPSFGGWSFVAFVVPHALALSARTKALVFPPR
jgi:hypothetical protein